MVDHHLTTMTCYHRITSEAIITSLVIDSAHAMMHMSSCNGHGHCILAYLSSRQYDSKHRPQSTNYKACYDVAKMSFDVDLYRNKLFHLTLTLLSSLDSLYDGTTIFLKQSIFPPSSSQ